MLRYLISVAIALLPIGFDFLRLKHGPGYPRWAELLGEGGLLLIAATLAAEGLVDLSRPPLADGWVARRVLQRLDGPRLLSAAGCLLSFGFAAAYYVICRGTPRPDDADVVHFSFVFFGIAVASCALGRHVSERSQ